MPAANLCTVRWVRRAQSTRRRWSRSRRRSRSRRTARLCRTAAASRRPPDGSTSTPTTTQRSRSGAPPLPHPAMLQPCARAQRPDICTRVASSECAIACNRARATGAQTLLPPLQRPAETRPLPRPPNRLTCAPSARRRSTTCPLPGVAASALVCNTAPAPSVGGRTGVWRGTPKEP